MLKISEFAQLAHTTRRTLIIYDKDGLFKPIHVNEEGYRFYDYDQLSEISFILALRKLGLSIDEIKQVSSLDQRESSSELLMNLKSKINDQISDLLKINDLLNQRMDKLDNRGQNHLYQPYEHINKETFYWKSLQLEDSSPQAIAKTFSIFYDHLDHFTSINGTCSGFLIDLSKFDLETFDQAPFSLVKESNVPVNDEMITTNTRPGGKYIAIDIESDVNNSSNNLVRGLKLLKETIVDRNIQTDNQLWEINLGEDIRIPNTTSSIIRLEFQIIE